MLTKAEVAYYRRILNITPDQIGPQIRGRQHGRISTYNHGCRCGECREARNESDRRYRGRKRAEARRRAVVHGTVTGYRNHGCRCEECKAAHAAASRETRRRRKDRAQVAA